MRSTNNKTKRETIDFGFDPDESEHHFLVIFPRKDEEVVIIERFQWDKDKREQQIDYRHDRPKVRLSKYKWDKISDDLREEFNRRLKASKLKVSTWRGKQVVLQRLFGKEAVLLAWAIEDCDPNVIPSAVKNWRGLRPEERWWLFTMANGATGDMEDKRGWRKAIRYALTENPILESKRQTNLFGIGSLED